MGISGCTACQFGGVDALKAYERTLQARQDNAASLQQQLLEQRRYTAGENNPTPGATVGGVIDIQA